MNEDTFAERVARLRKLGKVISGLDPEIRLEAFRILKDYVTGGASESARRKRGGGAEGPPPSPNGKEAFFAAREHGKPAENVKLMTAYLFSQYGSAPFTLAELATLAASVGLTVPQRIDMTLRQAKSGGKSLYTSAGRGKFKPTVHGETYLKETFQVSKGTLTKPDGEAAE